MQSFGPENHSFIDEVAYCLLTVTESEATRESIMESKDRRQIRATPDGSSRSTARMYEICDMLREDRVHCYVNGSAVLFVAWAVMLWAKNKEDLVPLLSRIPADREEVELFCVENRFISLLEKHVAPVTISVECAR